MSRDNCEHAMYIDDEHDTNMKGRKATCDSLKKSW